jgi:hypothetical protein
LFPSENRKIEKQCTFHLFIDHQSIEILDHLSDSINNIFTKVDWDKEAPPTTNPATVSQHNKFMPMLDDYSLPCPSLN